MKLLTVSNLYPRPDRPQAGMFNAQLFGAMAGLLQAQGGTLENLVLVPEWRPWRWEGITRWQSPHAAPFPTAYVPAAYVPVLGRNCSAATYLCSVRRAAAARFTAADMIFCSWLYPDGAMCAELAHATARPFWLMSLGSDVLHLDQPHRREQLLAACAQARGIVCVGAHLADRLRGAGVAPDVLHVVSNGVDPARFQYRERVAARHALREAGVPESLAAPETRVVLFVGNLAPEKAPELLVEAFAGMALPTSHLVMLGRGPLAAQLRKQSRALGLGGRVHVLGAQPHDRIALWMSAADVLCLCSHREGMPNVVLEALASGLPVVCTDVGACRDMVRGESAAKVVPAGDAGALTAALNAVLAASIDRNALSARHGKRTWRDQAAEILNLIGAES